MLKKYCIPLTEAERSELKALVTAGKAAARKRLRAQILLAADGDHPGGAMKGVLVLYARPRNPRRPLVCLDEPERSGDSRRQFCKQLIGEARAVAPAQPGQPERQDYEYIRHGM